MFVEDQLHGGRHTVNRTDENVEKFPHAVLADHRWTTDEISEITNVS